MSEELDHEYSDSSDTVIEEQEAKEKFKKIAIIYHELIETVRDSAGHISVYAENNALQVDYFLVAENQFPENQSLEGYDVTFIMGSPEHVYNPEPKEWFLREVAMITDAYHRKQKLIGICFGAQILAMIMGARVKRNHELELGFFPVTFNIEGNPLLEGIPDNEVFFHSHSDGFYTPVDAIEIAYSAASHKQEHYDETHDYIHTGSQGFMNEHILAVQFHPEVTPTSIEFFSQFWNHEESETTQSPDLIKMLTPVYTNQLGNMKNNCARDVFFRLLDNFLFAKDEG